MSNEHKAPTDRLNYTGDLTPIINDICTTYHLGAVQEFSVIEVGYEDCNVIIETEADAFLAKMFAAFRTPDDVERYATTIKKVSEAGVYHPELIETPAGETTHKTHGITLALLKFVAGKTFYDLGRPPDDDERKAGVSHASTSRRMRDTSSRRFTRTRRWPRIKTASTAARPSASTIAIRSDAAPSGRR